MLLYSVTFVSVGMSDAQVLLGSIIFAAIREVKLSLHGAMSVKKEEGSTAL